MRYHEIFHIARQGLGILFDPFVAHVAAEKVFGVKGEHMPFAFTVEEDRNERYTALPGNYYRSLGPPGLPPQKVDQVSLLGENSLSARMPTISRFFNAARIPLSAPCL